MILIINPEHPMIIEYRDKNGFSKVMHRSRPIETLDIKQKKMENDIITRELRNKAQDNAKIEIGPNNEYKTAAVEKSGVANSSAKEPNPARKITQENKAKTANPLQILHKFGLFVK